LYVCIERDTHLPWDGCNSSPSATRFDNDSSGLFSRTIQGCVTGSGVGCMNNDSTKAKLRNDTNVYFSIAIKNSTTSCITIATSCNVSGLATGCTLQITLVGLNGSNWDCAFTWPTSKTSNGRVDFNSHCGNHCQDYQLFCFAARIIGPCTTCKDNSVTLDDFSFKVRCPDNVEGHCKGIDDGCVGTHTCPECCECCVADLPTGMSKDAIGGGTKYCCENNFYLLSSGSYSCNIVNPYGNCSNYGLDDCDDTAPDSYVLDCINNGVTDGCTLDRTTSGDALYLYPCDCTFEAGDPDEVTSCSPAGIYYKGEDECSNNTEPCNGDGTSNCQ
jgi:hypothetical protein